MFSALVPSKKGKNVSTDHRMSVAEAARRMGMNVSEVKIMVFASKINGGKDQHGLWVDDRAVRKWLDENQTKHERERNDVQ